MNLILNPPSKINVIAIYKADDQYSPIYMSILSIEVELNWCLIMVLQNFAVVKPSLSLHSPYSKGHQYQAQ